MLNASEMGKLSWEKRKKKYSPEQLKELLSKAGKTPSKLPIDK